VIIYKSSPVLQKTKQPSGFKRAREIPYRISTVFSFPGSPGVAEPQEVFPDVVMYLYVVVHTVALIPHDVASHLAYLRGGKDVLGMLWGVHRRVFLFLLSSFGELIYWVRGIT
jgi:hypothetical protein